MSSQGSAEFELFAFFEMTPDLVCIAGKDGFFRNVNRAVIEKLGYTREELFASPIAAFIHPEDQERTGRRRSELLEGKPLMNFENRYVTKKGEIVWLHWTSVYFPEKEVVFAIAKDVTERKRMEKEVEEKYIKFQSLATYFKSSLEKDKKHLATELHEELAQLASAVKIDISWLGNHIPSLDSTSKGRLEHAQASLDLLINSIRRISFEVSPTMLDDLGLNETLQWLCEEFTLLSGIPCYFESTFNYEYLTQELRLDLFRICQGALSNVMEHADASRVIIKMEPEDNQLCLSIIDDGKGFDPKQLNSTPGLTGMRERAISVNGQLSVESKPGEGTCIRFTVALP